MRNLLLIQDIIKDIPLNFFSNLKLTSLINITDICVITELEEVFILFSNGNLILYSLNNFKLLNKVWNINLILQNDNDNDNLNNNNDNNNLKEDNEWFYVQYINENNSILCISYSGTICSLQSNRINETWNDLPEIEGSVDDGIGDASLSPDQTCLLIVTNNNTMLLMTNTFDVINEIPIEPRQKNTLCRISWSGDSMQFVLYSVDAVDNIARVRFYNRDLILLGEARTAADGPNSIVKNLLPALSYAPNGSMIAIAQQKTPKKQHIAILERTGLKHGEFEIQTPWIQENNLDEQLSFNVIKLQFNIETSVLAVGLQVLKKDTNQIHSQYVQLYHRNNYHWYLKQQFSGEGLYFGRFDSELPDRLYLTESPSSSSSLPSINNNNDNMNNNNTALSGFRFRTIDYVWDSCTAESNDGTTAVIDGKKILVTPLGKALVPPPMSLYTLDLLSPCRDISFFNNYNSTNEKSLSWGLVCLSDGDIIRLWTELTTINGTSKGQPNLKYEDINLSQIAKESNLSWDYYVRNVQAVKLDNTHSESSIAIICVISIPNSINDNNSNDNYDNDNYDNDGYNNKLNDKLIILRKEEYNQDQWVWRMEDFSLHSGSILRLINWSNETNSIGIGITSIESPFEVIKLTIDNNNNDNNDIQFNSEFEFSEPCARKLSVVKVNRNTDNCSKYLCIGLSSTPHSSRLYCCDNLLSSSHVSSFVINSSLDALLYVTATSKPQLHFASLQSLSHIVDEIESNLLASEASNQPLFTFSPPRPVERGARIVCSPLNSATVVLQIPRGNLEGCEPRPLVLMKSRILLDQKKYLECLLLLRKQRVDLNLLVDHDPIKFLEEIPILIPLMLKTNPDLIPLFISSLENGNICNQKYPLPEIYQGQNNNNNNNNNCNNNNLNNNTTTLVTIDNKSFTWDNKVNIVCEHIRNVLYDLIEKKNNIDNGIIEKKVDDLLLPLLCSYAKQRPPLLANALFVVKRYSLDLPLSPRNSSSDYLSTIQHISQVLSSNKTQKSLKYIAFLCDYKELFEAALGEGDFHMARAIARQGGQMDPKVYLPLIQSLESIYVINNGDNNNNNNNNNDNNSSNNTSSSLSTTILTTTTPSSSSSSSSSSDNFIIDLDVFDTNLGTSSHQNNTSYCLMRFRVYLHLSKPILALDWGLACLESISIKRAKSNVVNDETDINQLITDILTVISQNNLFSISIPKVRNLRQKIIKSISELPAPTTQNYGGLILKVKKKSTSSSSSGSNVPDNHIGLLPITSLLSKLFYEYGQSAFAKGQYIEAISSYLSSSEPLSPRCAIEAAIQNGDWQLALGLGGRYYNSSDVNSNKNNTNDEQEENPFFQNIQYTRSINPPDLARELIDSFRSSIEQGFGGESSSSEYYTLFQHNSKLYSTGSTNDSNNSGNSSNNNNSNNNTSTMGLDRAIEASQLCIEYFDDVEGAINILILSKRWRYAAQLASRKRRIDLLREEIGSTLKLEVQQILKVLKDRQEKHIELVEKLTKLWADGPGRLKAVSEVDPGLLRSLQGKANQEEGEDTRSDFGGQSVYSSLSMMSSTSTSSNTSNTSTLSLLSNLSIDSTNLNNSKKSEKSFAIDGIEHNLLSRGKTDRTEFTQYDNTNNKLKRRKQKMRSKNDGGGRDIFGLKQEGVTARLLYNLGDISAVSITVIEICEVLLVIGGNLNQSLACELQLAMDNYINVISSTIAPEAPLYPLDWLQKRNMEEVQWFQSSPQNLDENNVNSQKVWWRQAVAGINLWKSSRLITLSS